MNKKTLINGVLVAFMLLCAVNVSSQSKTLKDWTTLEEAEFHFDVSYTVVKCSPDSKAVILLNAFNEDGTNPKVGFTLFLSDDKGNKATLVVKPFETKLGDMFISTCDQNKHTNLKLDFPDEIDVSTVKVDITYQKG